MLVLPIPLIVVIILVYAAVRRWAVQRSNTGLLLIALCALQSLIIALVHFYEVSNLRWVQPMTASLVPPVAWLVFQFSGRRRPDPGTDGWHLAGPMLTLLSLLAMPDLLDLIIPEPHRQPATETAAAG